MRPVVITRCQSRPYVFTPPFAGEDYVLLLYVAATDVTAEEQGAISEAIIASGCRYAVCYGHRCTTWDDSIDMVCIVTEIEAGGDKQKFVMTSWHEKDSPEDVAIHFWLNTSFEDFVAERMSIFVLGSNPAIEGEIAREVARLNGPGSDREYFALSETTLPIVHS